MKFYLDTEFIEGTQTIHQWGMKVDYWLRLFSSFFIVLAIWMNRYFVHTTLLLVLFGVCAFIAAFLMSLSMPSTPKTIDLISIGIVAEDGREFYAVSKEFNLWEAWNRYQLDNGSGDQRNLPPVRVYWLRENVLKSIFDDLNKRQEYKGHTVFTFTYHNMKRLIKIYGVSNKKISKRVLDFIVPLNDRFDRQIGFKSIADTIEKLKPEFYGYYADYDWVVFCWLFGRMMDLPKGFPMYCIDLKQMLNELAASKPWYEGRDCWSNTGIKGQGPLQPDDRLATVPEKLAAFKTLPMWPKQVDEHNALSDAKWAGALHQFINYSR